MPPSYRFINTIILLCRSMKTMLKSMTAVVPSSTRDLWPDGNGAKRMKEMWVMRWPWRTRPSSRIGGSQMDLAWLTKRLAPRAFTFTRILRERHNTAMFILGTCGKIPDWTVSFSWLCAQCPHSTANGFLRRTYWAPGRCTWFRRAHWGGSLQFHDLAQNWIYASYHEFCRVSWMRFYVGKSHSWIGRGWNLEVGANRNKDVSSLRKYVRINLCCLGERLRDASCTINVPHPSHPFQVHPVPISRLGTYTTSSYFRLQEYLQHASFGTNTGYFSILDHLYRRCWSNRGCIQRYLQQHLALWYVG